MVNSSILTTNYLTALMPKIYHVLESTTVKERTSNAITSSKYEENDSKFCLE